MELEEGYGLHKGWKYFVICLVRNAKSQLTFSIKQCTYIGLVERENDINYNLFKDKDERELKVFYNKNIEIVFQEEETAKSYLGYLSNMFPLLDGDRDYDYWIKKSEEYAKTEESRNEIKTYLEEEETKAKELQSIIDSFELCAYYYKGEVLLAYKIKRWSPYKKENDCLLSSMGWEMYIYFRDIDNKKKKIPLELFLKELKNYKEVYKLY